MLGTLTCGSAHRCSMLLSTQAPQCQNSEGHATAAHMKDTGGGTEPALRLSPFREGVTHQHPLLPLGYSLTQTHLPLKVKVLELRWMLSGAGDRRDPGNFCSKGPALSFWSPRGRGGKLSTSSLWPCLQIHPKAHSPHSWLVPEIQVFVPVISLGAPPPRQ